MRIDPDGRTVQGVTVLILFAVLNVLYLLTCLPVVTIGAATSSLLEVTARYADHERGDLVRGYVAALRRNAARGTAVFLALTVPLLMLAFAGAFWFSMTGVATAVAGILSIAGVAYLLAALVYGLALVGTHTAALGQTLRNALLLPLAEPVRTGALLLIPAVGVSLLYVWPASMVLALTIGFSVGAYLCALVLRSTFARQAGGPAAERVSPHSGE
ncbi:YesL family protein [Xylanimonas sp. McL0601]|uniref:YesL family protein n=1 Tax=Xylanimonas sp. McL0601 TaxID=3414739 RepID=UPI003CF91896